MVNFNILAVCCLIVVAAESLSLKPTTRQSLACPNNPFFFNTERSEPLCDADTDCADTERCCFWSGKRHCLKGVDTTPKPGQCPDQPIPLPGVFANCIADFAGCQFDSQCSDDKKCCKNEKCGYSECKAIVSAPSQPVCTEIGCGPAPGPECQNTKLVRPNGLGCEPVCKVCDDPPTTPKACTEIGCGPAPGPECQNTKLVRPNGLGCEPVCRVCDDPPTTPKACTKIGCGAAPGPDCQNVNLVRPNGLGCAPVCKVCDDPPTTPKACTEIGCGPAPSPYCQKVKRVRPNGPGCGPVCKVCADLRPITRPRQCRWITELVCNPGSHWWRLSHRSGCRSVKRVQCGHWLQ